MPWISDPSPGPVALDFVSAVRSNRYRGEARKHENLGWLVELGRDSNGADQGWISYRLVGRVRDGRHVLLVHENGGGTLVSVVVLIVDVVPDTAIGNDGKPLRRLLIRNRGTLRLGDRYAGEVRVRAGRIEIGADARSGAPARMVDLAER